MTAWEDYDISQKVLGAEADHGDVLVCKSGTDFRDLSEITLEFETTPAGSVRKKVISGITGKNYLSYINRCFNCVIQGKDIRPNPARIPPKSCPRLSRPCWALYPPLSKHQFATPPLP
jgi:hypothetical protein